jgi:hypothetical protein
VSAAYSIRRALWSDLKSVFDLRAEAETWLRQQDIPQWTPDYGDYAREVMTKAVEDGSAWAVEEDSQIIATVSPSDTPDLDFWGWLDEGERTNTLYLSKMIVSRQYAGLDIGGAILNWASKRTSNEWLRLDVRRDNVRLQRYYLERLLGAYGRPGVEPWYQLMLFCRDPGWTQNHWAVYSNTYGSYWTKPICEVCVPYVTAQAGDIFNLDELFEIKRYDARFWTIKSVVSGEWIYVGADGRLYGRSWLGGDNLFEISSPNLSG